MKSFFCNVESAGASLKCSQYTWSCNCLHRIGTFQLSASYYRRLKIRFSLPVQCDIIIIYFCRPLSFYCRSPLITREVPVSYDNFSFQTLRSNEIRTLNPLRDLDKVAMNKLGLLRPRIPVSFGLGMPAHSCIQPTEYIFIPKD